MAYEQGRSREAQRRLPRAVTAVSARELGVDGHMVDRTSPFGTLEQLPTYVERPIRALGAVCINGGRRGFLVQLAPGTGPVLAGVRGCGRTQ